MSEWLMMIFQNVLPLLNESYDFIYIDAAKGQYYAWIDDCLRLLSPDGVIVMDNLFLLTAYSRKVIFHINIELLLEICEI